jgi:hypothetical protein
LNVPTGDYEIPGAVPGKACLAQVIARNVEERLLVLETEIADARTGKRPENRAGPPPAEAAVAEASDFMG